MPVTFTDKTIMPFGKYKGTILLDVPPSYLLWLYGTGDSNKRSPLNRYIEDNMQVLKQQARTQSQLKR